MNNKILKLFFEEPTKEINVREVARLLEISPPTASKKLKKFAKDDLLIERKEKGFNLYKADLDSDGYRDLKVYYNIRKVKECGLFDSLNKFYLKPTIVLFGSAAHGLDIENSDFDILIISEKKKQFPEIKKYEKKINRKLQIFVVKKINELKNEYLINNALSGMVLQGRIK